MPFNELKMLEKKAHSEETVELKLGIILVIHISEFSFFKLKSPDFNY